MLTLIIGIIALMIYVKIGVLAFKLTWGIFKVVLALVFSPIILVGLLIAGIFSGAIVLLVVMGLVALIASITAAA